MSTHSPDRIADAAKSRETRGLIRDIRFYLENLGLVITPVGATKGRGADGITVLRTKDGKLIATFATPGVADFFHRAGGWITELISEVERLERIAFEQRKERRRLREVADLVYKANQAGFNTTTGRHLLDQSMRVLTNPHYGDDD